MKKKKIKNGKFKKELIKYKLVYEKKIFTFNIHNKFIKKKLFYD